MSTYSRSWSAPGRPSVDPWLYAKPFWAGLAIVAMWLAVLFVGVIGDSTIVIATANTRSSVPVVAVVALAALVATLVIGARAFKASNNEDDLRRTLEDVRRAREGLASELAELHQSGTLSTPPDSAPRSRSSRRPKAASAGR
jgi:hypothetical protein